jgi:hypothetical protein
MPWVWLLYAPILIALRYNNLTALLVGLLLIGIWAYYKKRWWLLGFIIALTSGAKPQTTLVFAGALAWLAWREKNWRPIVVWGGVIGGLSLLLDPTWPLAWLHHIQTYQHSIRMTWHVWWLPIAVLLAFYRLWLPVLAILQVSLFPMQLHLYTLMPLLPGYTNQTWRTVVIVVICSWLWLFTVPLGMDQVLALTLCYILPFTLTSLPLRQIAKQLAVLDHKSLRKIR